LLCAYFSASVIAPASLQSLLSTKNNSI